MGRQAVIAPLVAGMPARRARARSTAWRRILATRQVKTAMPPQTFQDGGPRLTALGGSPNSFNVVASGDWTTTSAGRGLADGRMPGELVMDVGRARRIARRGCASP